MEKDKYHKYTSYGSQDIINTKKVEYRKYICSTYDYRKYQTSHSWLIWK